MLPILFQNEHFVVVNKPAGALSVPGRRGDKDPRPVVGLLLQGQLRRPIYPVHRLDVEVSGLLLMALAVDSHREANLWFEHKTIRKRYQALTGPASFPENELQTWRCLLLRGKKRAYESPVGKPSETHAWLRGRATSPQGDSCAVWELEPLTGRSHQLRYEMYRHQLPILGDLLYGSTEVFRSEQPEAIALCAQRLDFPQDATERFGLPKFIEGPALL